jgi:diguanylate cyclase (GGDEF)-like protein
VKTAWVYLTKFMESCKTAMVNESVSVKRQHREKYAMRAKDPGRDSGSSDSQFANKTPVKSTTKKTEQPLTKILICDDDLASNELIRSYLRGISDKEIVLLEAVHTKEIQNALDKGRIDLVLMDNQMLRRSGMEWLAERLKKQLAPIIVLTDSEDEEIETHTFQKIAVGYLPKAGLFREKLENMVDVALDKWSRLQQAIADEKKLEELANLDLLTGLHNRRAILGKLCEYVNLANRYRDDFTLVMLDIDHFGKVNDQHGYLTGDEVLEDIAALIRNNIRCTDIAGRYGGEKFIIILPKTNLSSSWTVAERLRSIIKQTEFKDAAGDIFSVTVSQGLAGWERNDDADSLISRTSEALHKAKEKGRDRVQILLGPSLRDKIQ